MTLRPERLWPRNGKSKVSLLPSILGVPLPSWMLVYAALLFGGFWWAVGAFTFHGLAHRRVYKGYSRLPYPLVTYGSPVNDMAHLLVKGIPNSFFEQLEANLEEYEVVRISCPGPPRRHAILKRSLRRFAWRRGADLDIEEGDDFAVVGGRQEKVTLGTIQAVHRSQAEEAEPSFDVAEQSEPRKLDRPQPGKRKIVID